MFALCNRADHYIFALWFLSFFCLLSSSSFSSSPNLSGRGLDVYHTSTHGVAWVRIYNACLKCAACGSLKIQDAKNRHFGTIVQLCRAMPSELRHVSTIGKNVLNSDTSSTCPRNTVNFGPLTTGICWRVWGTPANFNGFRILAALLHGTLLVGVNQTLRRRTKGATYILQGGHHVGNWPTFLVVTYFKFPIQVCFPCSARPARHRYCLRHRHHSGLNSSIDKITRNIEE